MSPLLGWGKVYKAKDTHQKFLKGRRPAEEEDDARLKYVVNFDKIIKLISKLMETSKKFGISDKLTIANHKKYNYLL